MMLPTRRKKPYSINPGSVPTLAVLGTDHPNPGAPPSRRSREILYEPIPVLDHGFARIA